MDRSGEGLTRGGQVLGMIHVILIGGVLVIWLLMFLLMIGLAGAA